MTDTIPVSRELLRQVLDYVEAGQPGHIADKINVLTALRAALEQPVQEADVWHEGSNSFYRAILLHPLTKEDAIK